jgi:hypothetical protein
VKRVPPSTHREPTTSLGLRPDIDLTKAVALANRLDDEETAKQLARTKRRCARWSWLVAAGILLLGLLVLVVAVLDHPVQVDYVRIESPSSVVVGVTVAPESWTRIAKVSDGANDVANTVRSRPVPGPGTALGQAVELHLRLAADLGDRSVIDATSGASIPITRCSAPMVFRPGCLVDHQ